MSCTGTPISWLRLEQYHAKELVEKDAEEIRAHLAECEACTACLAKIVLDDASALPPLPAPQKKVSFLRRAAPALTAFAIAAGILLVIRRAPPVGEPDASAPAPSVAIARIKGGDVSFVLVRDDESFVAEAGGPYRDGDRFKAVVTCPPGTNATYDLVVYERGDASFPLAAPTQLPCGNAVPMPGAFRLTGTAPLTVCVVWNDGPTDRAWLSRMPYHALPSARCMTLTPARAPE